MRATIKRIGDFENLSGREREIEFRAAGGVRCLAVRASTGWRLDDGPSDLIGNTYSRLRHLRRAVRAN